MKILSATEVAQLTDLMNERLGEFGDLFTPMPPGIVRLAYGVIYQWLEQPKLAPADFAPLHVRTFVADEIRTHPSNGQPTGEPWASGLVDEVQARQLLDEAAQLPPAPDVPQERTDDPQAAPSQGDTHPAAHPVAAAIEKNGATPDQAGEALQEKPDLRFEYANKPRTLAEVDAEERFLAGLDSEEKADLLRSIILELQMMASDREMPTMTAWDDKKPANMPKAVAIVNRYKLTWQALARYARLDFDPDERKKRRHSA